MRFYVKNVFQYIWNFKPGAILKPLSSNMAQKFDIFYQIYMNFFRYQKVVFFFEKNILKTKIKKNLKNIELRNFTYFTKFSLRVNRKFDKTSFLTDTIS